MKKSTILYVAILYLFASAVFAEKEGKVIILGMTKGLFKTDTSTESIDVQFQIIKFTKINQEWNEIMIHVSTPQVAGSDKSKFLLSINPDYLENVRETFLDTKHDPDFTSKKIEIAFIKSLKPFGYINIKKNEIIFYNRNYGTLTISGKKSLDLFYQSISSENIKSKYENN